MPSSSRNWDCNGLPFRARYIERETASDISEPPSHLQFAQGEKPCPQQKAASWVALCSSSSPLPTPVSVLLGNESWGAVKAAMDGGKLEGNLGWLIQRVEVGKDMPKEPKAAVAAGVKNNAVRQAQLLTEQSKVIQEFVHGKRVQIAAGVYGLSSGKVDWQEMPQAKEKGDEKREEPKEGK